MVDTGGRKSLTKQPLLSHSHFARNKGHHNQLHFYSITLIKTIDTWNQMDTDLTTTEKKRRMYPRIWREKCSGGVTYQVILTQAKKLQNV